MRAQYCRKQKDAEDILKDKDYAAVSVAYTIAAAYSQAKRSMDDSTHSESRNGKSEQGREQ